MKQMFTRYADKGFSLKNRVVRSATADMEVDAAQAVQGITIQRYRKLAENNIGLIITGDFSVSSPDLLGSPGHCVEYGGIELLPDAVHRIDPEVKIFAQLSTGYIMRIPSLYDSPFGDLGMDVLTADECHSLAAAFAKAAERYRIAGYDGVQLHAAHGGPLSLFLSPFTNRRIDKYADPVEIFRELLDAIRDLNGDFPIALKMNCTDYMPGGLNKPLFQDILGKLAGIGYDLVEVSGGIWDCLSLSEQRLGFPPRPSAESHTALGNPCNQDYFRPYVQGLELSIPIILAGGHVNKARCEDIIASGDADLLSFCRPLICEPDLMTRWAGGSNEPAACIACNSCLYELYERPDSPGTPIRCVYREDRVRYRKGLDWGKGWATRIFGNVRNTHSQKD